jgi:hypothetical protein
LKLRITLWTAVVVLVVATSTVALEAPASAPSFWKIEEMAGWESCTVCAGPGGNGPTAEHSIWQGITTPSTDGKAAQFNVSGGNPWSAALWWKQLGGNDSVRHFVYDLYYYTDNPGAPQALEFDVNQSTRGGNWYIFGTECDLKGSQTWRVWDSANSHWVSTGVHCAVPQAYTWHHLTWEFERTPDNRVHFVTLTLNGEKHYIDMYFWPTAPDGSGIDVAFQIDLDGRPNPARVWLDQVSLTYW